MENHANTNTNIHGFNAMFLASVDAIEVMTDVTLVMKMKKVMKVKKVKNVKKVKRVKIMKR